MDKYHFTNIGGPEPHFTVEQEASSLKEAHILAVQYLGELLAEDGAQFWRDQHTIIEVRDADDLVICRLDLLGTQAPAASASVKF